MIAPCRSDETTRPTAHAVHAPTKRRSSDCSARWTIAASIGTTSMTTSCRSSNGLGVDLGLAFARVSVVHLAAWPVDLPALTERALRNLRKRARHATDYDLVEEPVGGVPAMAFQSRDGWASTAVLIPEAIERLFGRAPGLFIAPSRDLLVRLPPDVDLEFATWLSEEFETADPNALRLEAFEWRDGTMRCRPLARDSAAV